MKKRHLFVHLILSFSFLSGCLFSSDDSDNNVGVSSCGDGVLNSNESCDGDTFGEDTCASLGLGVGQLKCSTTCELDTTGCAEIAEGCGDGTVIGQEECEEGVQFTETCQDLGFDSGTLSCAACKFDTEACIPSCGNGEIDEGEECDGADVDGLTCETQGFLSGALACDENCKFEVSQCLGNSCGDGILSDDEECDWTISPLNCNESGMGTRLDTVSPTCTACKIDKDSCDTSLVSVGTYNASILHPDGSFEIWGRDEQPAQVDGSFIGPVDTNVKFRQMHIAHEQICGVAPGDSGSILCWGQNSNHESGYDYNGTAGFLFSEINSALAESNNRGFVQVTGTRLNGCGLYMDGTIACWGLRDRKLDGVFLAVELDLLNVCGMTTDGRVDCSETSPDSTMFFSQIRAGLDQTCGVTTAGEIKCWGACAGCNTNPPGNKFTQVAVGGGFGDRFVCGLKLDKKVECFSDTNTPTGNEIVANVPPTQKFIQIDASEFDICGLTDDANAKVVCWGRSEITTSPLN